MTKVTAALQEGVNVLIWSFISFEPKHEIDASRNADTTSDQHVQNGRGVQIKAELDVSKYRHYRNELSRMGYDKVVHLAAFGGWNGPHLPPGYSSKELYDAFNRFNVVQDEDDHMLQGTLFDGIDWDLEGMYRSVRDG